MILEVNNIETAEWLKRALKITDIESKDFESRAEAQDCRKSPDESMHFWMCDRLKAHKGCCCDRYSSNNKWVFWGRIPKKLVAAARLLGLE